jgi:hypothetical protein
LPKTDALETADLDQLQRKALARHQRALEAALGPHEESAVSAQAKFAGHSQAWYHMAASASAREQEGAGACVAGGWWLVAGV